MSGNAYVCICIYMYIYMYVYVYVFDAVLPTPIRGKGVCLRISHFDSIIRCETPGSSDTWLCSFSREIVDLFSLVQGFSLIPKPIKSVLYVLADKGLSFLSHLPFVRSLLELPLSELHFSLPGFRVLGKNVFSTWTGYNKFPSLCFHHFRSWARY